MATSLPVAHSHSHAFLAVILLVPFAKCAAWGTFLRTSILIDMLPILWQMALWSQLSIFVLSKVLVLISIFIILIFFGVKLVDIFWSSVHLFKSLVAYGSITWHLTTSTRNSVNDSLLIGLASATSAFVSCGVSVEMAIVSSTFVRLTWLKVVFCHFPAVNLVSSVLKAAAEEVWTAISSHLFCSDLMLLNRLLLVSSDKLFPLKVRNSKLLRRLWVPIGT